MNVVEFILSIKDGASHPLGQLTKSALGSKLSLDDLTKANEKLKGVTDKTGNSIGSVREKIKKLQEMKDLLPVNAHKQIKQVNEEIEKLEKGLGKLDKKPEGGGFMEMLKGFAVPAVAIGAGIAGSINEGMKNSRTKLNFQLLEGKDAGNTLYEGLTRMKGLLGDGVFDMGKQLADGMDVSAIVPTLSRLGDVAFGDQTKVAGLASAFSQLHKDGKLTDATLSALEQNGFKPLVAISETTGESISNLRGRFINGKITAQELEKALKATTDQGGRFHGIMEQIANSPAGKWDELINQVKEFAGWLGDQLLPVAMEVIDFLKWGFDTVKEPLADVVGWCKDLYKWIKENRSVLEPLVTILGGFAVGIWAVVAAQSVWAAITAGVTTAIEVMSTAIMSIPVIGWILAAIGAVIAAVVYLRNNFEGFGDFFSTLWEGVKMNWDTFVESIKYGVGTIGYWIESMVLKVKNFGQYIMGLFDNIGKAISLATDFKFSEAKAALTATITTEASKEIQSLNKEHKKNQDKFDQAILKKGLWDATHPFGDIIHRKKQDEDPNAATEQATGGSGMQDYLKKNDLKNNGVKDEINAISGGGVKNITVTVGKMFELVEFHIQNGTKQIGYEIERMAEEAVTRAIASATNK